MLHVACVESLLARYLNAHAFTELHLDSIFKYGDDNTLPLEVNVMNTCMYYCVVDCGPGGRWWQPTTGFMTMHAVTCRLTA